MTIIYLSIIYSILLILDFVIALILYKRENKESYSLLTMFPFELKSKEFNFNILLKSILAVALGIMSVFSIYHYFYEFEYSFIVKAFGIILVLTNFFLLGLFVIDMKSYKAHVILMSIFYVMNFISYCTYGFYQVKIYNGRNLWILLICFIIAAIILISMFTPILSSWYLLKKEEKEGDVIYSRGKIFVLSFIEWVNVFLYILMYILIFIETLI